MDIKIRLDQSGNPYLVIKHQEQESHEEGDAGSDAENIFFRRLQENHGTMSVLRKGGGITVLLTTAHGKREISVGEIQDLGLKEVAKGVARSATKESKEK